MEFELHISPRSQTVHVVDVKSAGLVRYSLEVRDNGVVGVALSWAPAGGAPPRAVQPLLRLGPRESHYFPAMERGELTFTFDCGGALLTGRTLTLRLSREALPASMPPTAGLRVAEDAHALNRLALRGVHLFFTNQFAAAEAFFEGERLRVPIFSLSYATLCWLRALMTWDAEVIAETNKRLCATQALCEVYMGAAGGGLAGALGLGGAPLSPLQLEATLTYADASLLLALLNLMDESIMSLVKCGLNLRTGWKLYQAVDRALGSGVMGEKGGGGSAPLGADAAMAAVEPEAPPAPAGSTAADAELRAHVEGGLLFGAGGFNAIASLLPPIIVRLLAVVGFPNDRAAGLSQLRRCFLGGLARAPLAGLLILGVRVVLPSFHAGAVAPHAGEAASVLAAMAARMPESVLPLWLGGRLARLSCRPAVARDCYARAGAAAGNALLQVGHLCVCALAWQQWLRGARPSRLPLRPPPHTHTPLHARTPPRTHPPPPPSADELAWVDGFSLRWPAVLSHATKLQAENAWSKAFYAYLRGVALLELGRLGEARDAMLDVLTLSSRKLGGRVIPAEQFALRRAATFVCLTAAPPGAPSRHGRAAEAELLARAAGGGGSHLPPPRALPAHVAPGSPAHAAALAYPLTLPGLELLYYFGGFSQMRPVALGAALRAVDAVVDVVGGGGAFGGAAGGDARAQPLWEAGARGGGATAEAPADAAAANAAWPAGAVDEEGGEMAHAEAAMRPGDAPAAVAALARAAAAPRYSASAGAGAPAPAAGGGWGSSLFSTLKSVGAGVAAAASSAVANAAAVAGGGGGGGDAAHPGSPSASSASKDAAGYATATPTLPFHAAAVAALLKGAITACLGRADEASGALRWAVEAAPGALGGDAAAYKRELHTLAYAHYELGLLGMDVMHARLGHACGGGGGARGGASSRERCTLGPAFAVLRTRFADALPTPAAAAAACAKAFKSAKGVRDDFPWRVRLHIRVHLAGDDMRSALAGGVAAAEEEEEEEEGEEGGEGLEAVAAELEAAASAAEAEGVTKKL